VSGGDLACAMSAELKINKHAARTIFNILILSS